MRGLLANESGQMAVELAVALPVLLLALVIVLDVMSFMGECARFDHLAAQAVLAQGTSPGADDYDIGQRAARVQAQIAESFAGGGSVVSVEAHKKGGVAFWETYEFTCRMEMAPWPFAHGSLEVLGAHVPMALAHERSLAVEPYTPGRLL